MLADSDQREAGDTSCPDCVITVRPDGQAGLGPAEHRALRALAAAGLIAPLRPRAGPGRSATVPQAGHRSDTSPLFTARMRTRRVKAGPSVGESVETVLALH